MKLIAPQQAPEFFLRDSQGALVEIGTGKKMLLSFFRDTNCPFCNFRIFQMTQRHKQWSAMGLEVVAFFYSSHEEVAHFTRVRPRPFKIVADPENTAYRLYGIERSLTRKMKSVFARLWMWIQGMRILGLTGAVRGLGGINTNNMMPADFLIDEQGYIVEVYYGQDAGDHIPLESIDRFIGLK